ncbi:single-stranded DNA-binding protein [Peptoniphilus sp. GNH]|nr:single-stranded DNA-binding protein [Peptoniphilus sp. GNH]
MNRCDFYGIIASELNLKVKKNRDGEDFSSLFFSIGVREGAGQYSYIPCVAYNKVAKLIVDYCKKDDYIAIEGNLRIYEATQGAEVINRFNIQVNKVYFMNNRVSEPEMEILDQDDEYMIVKK